MYDSMAGLGRGFGEEEGGTTILPGRPKNRGGPDRLKRTSWGRKHRASADPLPGPQGRGMNKDNLVFDREPENSPIFSFATEFAAAPFILGLVFLRSRPGYYRLANLTRSFSLFWGTPKK